MKLMKNVEYVVFSFLFGILYVVYESWLELVRKML